MEIKNFTDNVIRLGEYPVSVDVTNIPDNHSSYGVMVALHTYRMGDDQHFFQIRKNSQMKGAFVLVYFKWEEQLEKVPEHLSEIVFDSRNFDVK
jgi:hypothetical protein